MSAESSGNDIHKIRLIGVTVLAVGFGLILFGIYWARYARGGIIAGLILLLGFILASHESGLERGGHQRLWRTRTDFPTKLDEPRPFGEFETEVLNNTRSLAARIGLKNFKVERVVWGPSAEQIRNVASGECHFDRHDLVLSSRLRNLLTADEWTPLVAVSLIYDQKLMPRVFRKRQIGFFLPWILVLTVLLILTSYPGNSIVAIPALFWLFIPFTVAIRAFWSTDHRLKLEANSETGALLGQEQLATVLAKISTNVTQPITVSQGGDELPTISERLARLEPMGVGYQNPEVRTVRESLQKQEAAFQEASKAAGTWRRHKRLIFTSIFLFLLIVPVTAFLVWDNSVCPHLTIIPSSTRIVVPPTGHSDYPFFVSNVIWDSRPIWGSFTATKQVSMFIMTAGQYDNFNSTGTTATYLFNSSPVTSATYECGGSAGCPPEPFAHLGQEYVVFQNSDTSSSTTVTIDQDIYLGGC